MAVDSVALLYSALGGFFMGSYPVPIKAPSVLKANVHPMIFQCYKSFWVFVVGWIFVLANLLRGHSPVYAFTWWGTVSAAAWIPAGLCVIAAVPRLGVGTAIVLATGTSSTLSFLVFWLVLGESMKMHGSPGHTYYLAPYYLIAMLIGMGALVAAPKVQLPKYLTSGASEREVARPRPGDDDEDEEAPLCGGQGGQGGQDGKNRAASNFTTGVGLAMLGGFFAAVQFGVVTQGKRVAMQEHGCEADISACPVYVQEQFNDMGSWFTNFGVGTALITLLFHGGYCWSEVAKKEPIPSLQLGVLAVPGSVAGMCWALGNIFQVMAVVRGGNAVMMPSNQAIQLLTSGLWSLLYYREVRDPRRIVLWCVAATWLLVSMILLSKEKMK